MTKYYIMEVDDESAAEYPDSYGDKTEHPAATVMQYIAKHKDFPTEFPPMEIEIYDDPRHNKLNDFIFSPVDQYCVSGRVKTVLQQFKLPTHRFYPITVFRPKKLFYGSVTLYRRKLKDKYFAFHYDCANISDTKKFIDYEKTVMTKDNYGLNQTKEIILNKNFDHSLDLFELDMSWMTYVSERLMNALKEINATGLIFSEINERQYIVPRPNPKLTWT